MTPGIATILLILGLALVLFLREKPRMDVVALLVLSLLAMTRLVSPEAALAGFSNPAAVTVWAMFILSAGLSATGVSDVIGTQVLRFAGRDEPRIIIAVMLTTGVLSAFMNNIGVAAMMLPVTMDIARRTGVSPARLLMPMAYASLLGGLTTLIGTPPNLVASNALRAAGHDGFKFFEFAPIGVPALIVGTLFVAFAGRHFLPARRPADLEASLDRAGPRLRFAHDLEARRFRLRVDAGSALVGKTLREARLGAALGMQVYEIHRTGETIAQPGPDFALRTGDILFVQGRSDEWQSLLRWKAAEVAHGTDVARRLALQEVILATATVSPDSDLAGLSVREIGFRRTYGSHLLSIQRGTERRSDRFADHVFQPGDELLLATRGEALAALSASPEFAGARAVQEERIPDLFPEGNLLLECSVTGTPSPQDIALSETGLGDALGLWVIGIVRATGTFPLPDGSARIGPGDRLLVHGSRESLELLRGLQGLTLIPATEPEEVVPPAAEESGSTEVTLAPQSALVGKTLADLDFRHRYGLQVLSIWRQGRAYRSHLGRIRLQFGDALLLSGPRNRVEALAKDEDFLMLTRSAYPPRAKVAPSKTWFAAFVMLAVVGVTVAGLFPISVAAVAGATLMILGRCLSIEEAHRAIDWKAVFLIACLIPLGSAMEESGAAEWLARGMTAAAAPFGRWGLILALYGLTTLATIAVPTTALVIIMSSIGLSAAEAAGIPPRMIVMVVTMAAAASFASPISHPANVLVMGPGGYRFQDYLRQGLLLAVVVAATVLPLIAWRYGTP